MSDIEKASKFNGKLVALIPTKEKLKTSLSLFLIGGERLSYEYDNELKEAFEKVNKIKKGVAYCIEKGIIFPDADCQWWVVDDCEKTSTRKVWIERSLAACCISRYHLEGADFTIPSVIEHSLWGKLSRSVSSRMKVWELALLMYPIEDGKRVALKHKKKYRSKRRELMLDMLASIKRGGIESVYSLKREKEYWRLDVNHQVDIVVSIEEVAKHKGYKTLVFLWREFMAKQECKNIEEGIPERVELDYVTGSVESNGVFNGVDKNTIEDWEGVLPVSYKDDGVEDWEVDYLHLGKTSMRYSGTDEKYQGWYERACSIAENWDSYEHRKPREKISKTKIYEKVADEFKVSKTAIHKAINHRFAVFYSGMKK